MSAPLARLEDALAPEIYGGKAAGLARALRAGLPVPAGFAIAVDVLAELAAGYAGHAARALLGALSEMLATLEDGPLAVRSSAVGEDSASASFAGVHATILGPQGSDAVLGALGRLHESAHTAQAAAYRRQAGFTDRPRIGAVIQQLVIADVAGVMFTPDPSGDQQIIIEASFGLGESVVAGLVTPDHYVLHRDGTLHSQRIGDKTLTVHIDLAAGTTRQEPVAAALAARPCLSPDQLGSLADLACRTEDVFGPAQDVEWAIARDEVHLLQARPVTAPWGVQPSDAKPTPGSTNRSSSTTTNTKETPC